MKKRQDRQIFLFSLGMSLFLLLTAVGAAAVDVRGRRLSFGDERPPFRKVAAAEEKVELEVYLFGREALVDITRFDKMWKFLLDFTCIPHN